MIMIMIMIMIINNYTEQCKDLVDLVLKSLLLQVTLAVSPL